MWPNPQFLADSVIFTEEMLYGKFHFCAVFVRGWTIICPGLKEYLFLVQAYVPVDKGPGGFLT